MRDDLPPVPEALVAPGSVARLPTTERFSFVVLSDRTGMGRPGVFERAIEVVNLLQPTFVVQIGDLIDGYTTDPVELERQWDAMAEVTDRLEAPLFRVPGNHDVSNDLARAAWLRRHGPLHHSWCHHDVLFVVLDTQDPPAAVDAIGGAGGEAPDVFDPDGPVPASLGADQVRWVHEVLREHAEVRWTFVFLHMPVWQGWAGGGSVPGWDDVVGALGERPCTVVAGHVHNYGRVVIGGREHLHLGPTGGVWVVDEDPGNIDQVLLVNVGDGRPVLANVLVDGVLGPDDVRPRRSPF